MKCEFSPCRKYRYTLWRHPQFDLFDPAGGNRSRYVQFIGLNPSTADEVVDDNTVRRCIDFARRWGYGAMCMTNAFAWRETDPSLMKLQPSPIGPENDKWLIEIAKGAGIVVAAWGKDGSHLKRNTQIHALFKSANIPLWCFGLNSDGSPKHPLYLSKSLDPQPYVI